MLLRVGLGIWVRLIHCDLEIRGSSCKNKLSACRGITSNPPQTSEWQGPRALGCPNILCSSLELMLVQINSIFQVLSTVSA